MSNNIYLNKAQLKAELERCLKCANKPCMKACPVHCCPQEFISQAKEGKNDEAVASIVRQNSMGQTCGLICPDKFCMKACTRSRIDFAINIPRVQATLLENFRSPEPQQMMVTPNGKKVAIIGAGPAGLSAADELSKQGFAVCIYEAGNKIGGALNLIPEERLPHSVIEKDAAYILNNPLVTLHLNSHIDNPSSLFNQHFDAVIMASGEQNMTTLNIEGKEHAIAYTEYLSHPEKYQTNGKVAVIGGGNVAADCAFTAHKNGACAVEMFVRRRLSDMRISQTEHRELIEKEINVNTLTSPSKIISENNTLTLFVRKNSYNDGVLEPIANSEVGLDNFALVITAIGSRALPKEKDERIVYAGDCLTGGSTLVEALASGRQTAKQVAENLLK